MKNKFKIGSVVRHIGTGVISEVKDFELFDNFYLYYLNENTAYPESQLVEVSENDYNRNNYKNVLGTFKGINLGDGWLIDPDNNEPIYF